MSNREEINKIVRGELSYKEAGVLGNIKVYGIKRKKKFFV